MKLAFVLHNLVRGNGQGRINYEIAMHALREGHEVHLLADKVAPEVVDAGAKRTRIQQLPHRPNLIGAYTFAAMADRALSSGAARNANVIIGAGFTLRSPHHVNLCQFVHGAWLKSPVHVSKIQRGPEAWYQALYSRCNARWERQAYASARCVVAPSKKIRLELELSGVEPEKIEVIHNGVDLSEFQHGPQSREALGLPVGVPLALFVGDIRTPRKNLDTVLRAMVKVPKIHLAVVGALERSPFPAMAERLGVAHRVRFVGFRSDVNQFMRACDLFVFPSRYEAGTLVIMEALASGLPVVTARTAGGCEVMSSDCGIVLDDANDSDAIAHAMKQIATAEVSRRAEMARSARNVAEKHSWSQMAARYLKIFQSAADR